MQATPIPNNANGELATKVDASGTTTYTYDVLGNLKAVDPPLSNDVIDYVVDGQNRRIAKKVDGTITRKWLYGDQLNPVAELDVNDNITKRFIYATASNVPDVMVDVSGASPVVYRIISDHLGSPRFVVDISNGTTALELDYDEWGVETVVSGNRDLIPFGFAGGLYDQDTKLVRFGARDYDPEIARWTSKDPIEFKGGDTNLFGYVLNDPINLIDPSGKFWETVATVGRNIVKIATIPVTIPGAILKICLLAGELYFWLGDDEDESGPQVLEHGNSKTSTKAQHGYEIYDTREGEVCKTGISGCKLNKDGTSPRANSQASKWNKEPGNEGRYEARMVETFPEGPGARQKALDWEEKNAEKHRLDLDPKRHQRP